MTNNAEAIQKQIKAFNKYLKRAENAGVITDKLYEPLSNLIIGSVSDNRMTKSGYAKAGTKYLSNLSEEELNIYSTSITAARNLLEMAKREDDILEAIDFYGDDPLSSLWKMYDYGKSQAYFDSEQIYSIAQGEVDVSIETAIFMMAQINREDNEIGVGDIDKWYKSLPTLT